jgi:hypothetical protein
MSAAGVVLIDNRLAAGSAEELVGVQLMPITSRSRLQSDDFSIL